MSACVCIYECVHMCLYMCVHVEARVDARCLPQASAPLFDEAWSLTEPRIHGLTTTAGVTGTQCHTQLFMWVLRIQTQVLMPVQQAFYLLTISLALR